MAPPYSGGIKNKYRFEGYYEYGAIVCGCNNIGEHVSGYKRKMYISKWNIHEPVEIKSFWDFLKEKTIPYYTEYMSDKINKAMLGTKGVKIIANLNKILVQGSTASLQTRQFMKVVKSALIFGDEYIEEQYDGLTIGSFWDYLQEKAKIFSPNFPGYTAEGTMVLNTVDSKLYVKANGVWKTAGS